MFGMKAQTLGNLPGSNALWQTRNLDSAFMKVHTKFWEPGERDEGKKNPTKNPQTNNNGKEGKKRNGGKKKGEKKKQGEAITFVPSEGKFSQSGLLDWVLLQGLGSCSVWLQQKCLLKTLWTFHMLRPGSEFGIWTPLCLSVMGCKETVKLSIAEAHLIVEFRPISGSKLQSEIQLCAVYCSFVGTLQNMWHLPYIQKGVDFVCLTKMDCVHLTLLS